MATTFVSDGRDAAEKAGIYHYYCDVERGTIESLRRALNFAHEHQGLFDWSGEYPEDWDDDTRQFWEEGR